MICYAEIRLRYGGRRHLHPRSALSFMPAVSSPCPTSRRQSFLPAHFGGRVADVTAGHPDRGACRCGKPPRHPAGTRGCISFDLAVCGTMGARISGSSAGIAETAPRALQSLLRWRSTGLACARAPHTVVDGAVEVLPPAFQLKFRGVVNGVLHQCLSDRRIWSGQPTRKHGGEVRHPPCGADRKCATSTVPGVHE